MTVDMDALKTRTCLWSWTPYSCPNWDMTVVMDDLKTRT